MRSLHLTVLIFCQVLLASFILYSNLATALPFGAQQHQLPPQVKPYHLKPMPKQLKEPAHKEVIVVAEAKPEPKSVPVVVDQKPKQPEAAQIEAKSIAPAVAPTHIASSLESSKKVIEAPKPEIPVAKSATIEAPIQEHKVEPATKVAAAPVVVPVAPSGTIVSIAPVTPLVSNAPVASADSADPINRVAPAPVAVKESTKQIELSAPINAPVLAQPIGVEVKPEQTVPVSPIEIPESVKQQPIPVASPLVSASVVESPKVEPQVVSAEKTAPVPVVVPIVATKEAPVFAPAIPVSNSSAQPVEVSLKEQSQRPASLTVTKLEPLQSDIPPVVKGGLGPLHMLATTLCNYRPDKPVADENLNQLYCQRAQIRKSLFEFMSLKFTNLEKLSSRLNPGLEVVPPKTTDKSSVVPSHGWPVVGKCTAHDLKLMAEAAWCECEGTNCTKPASPSVAPVLSTEALDKLVPTISSNKHLRSEGSRRLAEPQPIEQSAVISKMLHVADVKDAPVLDGAAAELSSIQQQLASIQAQATGEASKLCKRNALRLTKALFNHLAEDQNETSDSWPKLHAQLYEDDCARRRVIDIITALSGFRSESTSIRRDNVEFAFAMDDLRAKVLESDLNSPLTFDRQFIEVEQFLQQSVKLMLANIDPGRAKLTSMRYRSLMPGPLSADDQCIELHQRLMSKNNPTDCNPTQFGQLPDVLRMTANSLELWSVEKELAKYQNKSDPIMAPLQPKRTVNECIAHLVSN